MAHQKPKSIIILGGGTAGWVCGAVLAKHASENGVTVTIVDTADIPTIGVGEASIPTLYDMLNHVGLTDSDLVKSAEATFKYGVQFENWSKPGEKYMHGFGNMGTALRDREFFSVWLGAAQYFKNRDLAFFTPATAAAEKGRFARVAMRPKNSPAHIYYPLQELSYALHFDASLLARLLKQKALDSGAVHLSRHVVDVEMNEAGIVALTTKDGERLTADFFVDCSGFYGYLSRKALGGKFEDWSDYLPCDNAVTVQTARNTPPRLYTRSIAHSAGWRWEIQLQNRTGNGLVYDSNFMTDQAAMDLLMQSVEGEPITEPRKIGFQTGHLKAPWNKNCVAIGLSAGFLEPLESTSIHLICKYAMLLEDKLYKGQIGKADQDMFNLTWREEAEEIRNFLVAHYVVNQRDDDPFWRGRQTAPRPDTLNTYLNQLQKTGWISLPKQALFGNDSWYQVLVGQRFPLDYERFAVPAAQAPEMVRFLENVARAVDIETHKIPRTHQQILDELRAVA
ncbi:MAG: tryptophan halogenase family protein [Asticcacaulis sp.]